MESYHPSSAALDLYRLAEFPASEFRATSNHLMWCAECRRIVLDAPPLARLVEALIEHDAVTEYTCQEHRAAAE